MFREVHHSLYFEKNKLVEWKKEVDSEANDNALEESKKLSKEIPE